MGAEDAAPRSSRTASEREPRKPFLSYTAPGSGDRLLDIIERARWMMSRPVRRSSARAVSAWAAYQRGQIVPPHEIGDEFE